MHAIPQRSTIKKDDAPNIKEKKNNKWSSIKLFFVEKKILGGSISIIHSAILYTSASISVLFNVLLLFSHLQTHTKPQVLTQRLCSWAGSGGCQENSLKMLTYWSYRCERSCRLFCTPLNKKMQNQSQHAQIADLSLGWAVIWGFTVLNSNAYLPHQSPLLETSYRSHSKRDLDSCLLLCP